MWYVMEISQLSQRTTYPQERQETKVGVSAAVEKKHCLTVLLCAFAEKLHEPSAEDAVVARLKLRSHIDNFHAWQRAVLNALRQLE